MYVQDYAPMQQAAISRLRRNRDPGFVGIPNLISAVQGMKTAPQPTSAQVARIYAALNGMTMGRSRNLSNNGIRTMPYDLNSAAPVYETLPARKSYPNDTLQLLLNHLGQGL